MCHYCTLLYVFGGRLDLSVQPNSASNIKHGLMRHDNSEQSLCGSLEVCMFDKIIYKNAHLDLSQWKQKTKPASFSL